MMHDHTMRFGSTAKVLLKCKLKYYRISECDQRPMRPSHATSHYSLAAGTHGEHTQETLCPLPACNYKEVLGGGHVGLAHISTGDPRTEEEREMQAGGKHLQASQAAQEGKAL